MNYVVMCIFLAGYVTEITDVHARKPQEIS